MITLTYCPRCEKWNSIDYMVAVRGDDGGEEESLIPVCRGSCLQEGEESGTIAVISYQTNGEVHG